MGVLVDDKGFASRFNGTMATYTINSQVLDSTIQKKHIPIRNFPIYGDAVCGTRKVKTALESQGSHV